MLQHWLQEVRLRQLEVKNEQGTNIYVCRATSDLWTVSKCSWNLCWSGHVVPEGFSADSVVQVAVQVHGHNHGSNLRKRDYYKWSAPLHLAVSVWAVVKARAHFHPSCTHFVFSVSQITAYMASNAKLIMNRIHTVVSFLWCHVALFKWFYL